MKYRLVEHKDGFSSKYSVQKCIFGFWFKVPIGDYFDWFHEAVCYVYETSLKEVAEKAFDNLIQGLPAYTPMELPIREHILKEVDVAKKV